MKDILISILEKFAPVFLQGTLNADEDFPQKFITFFVEMTTGNGFFDDLVVSTDWRFSVIFYSDDPNEVNSIPAQITDALFSAGFIPQGKGNDIASGKPSHTGWAMEFVYNEK